MLLLYGFGGAAQHVSSLELYNGTLKTSYFVLNNVLYTAAHCSTLPYTAVHCRTLQYTVVYSADIIWMCSVL